MKIPRVLLITISLAVVLLPGCSQSKSQQTLRVGSAKWVQVNDELVSAVKAEAPPTIKAETFLATGRLIESQGNFIQAAKIYRKACQVRPDYVAAWNRLGISCDKLGQYDRAEEAFREALNLAPETSFLHNNLGFSYLLSGKYELAEQSLRKALSLNGQFQRARVNLGLALAKQGKFDQALIEFKKALPEAQAYYNIAYLHRLAGQWHEAGNYYKQAWALDPSLAEAKENLALLQEGYTTDE